MPRGAAMAAMAAALLAAGACHHSRMVLGMDDGMDDPCPLCSYDMGAQPVRVPQCSAVPFEWTALTPFAAGRALQGLDFGPMASQTYRAP